MSVKLQMGENYIDNQNTQVRVATGPTILGIKISVDSKNCIGTPNCYPDNAVKNDKTRVFNNLN